MRSNKAHRKFINQLPCATCNALPPSQCSHIRRNTDCGTGIKPHDKWSIPQCDKCHRRVEYIITKDNTDMFKELALYLYRVSGDWENGVTAILNFRRKI